MSETAHYFNSLLKNIIMYIKFLSLMVTFLLPLLLMLSIMENIPTMIGFSLILIPVWFLVLCLLAHEEQEGRL